MITTSELEGEMCLNLSCLSSQFEMLSMIMESNDDEPDFDIFQHFIPEFAFSGTLKHPRADNNPKGKFFMESSQSDQKHGSKVQNSN